VILFLIFFAFDCFFYFLSIYSFSGSASADDDSSVLSGGSGNNTNTGSRQATPSSSSYRMLGANANEFLSPEQQAAIASVESSGRPGSVSANKPNNTSLRSFPSAYAPPMSPIEPISSPSDLVSSSASGGGNPAQEIIKSGLSAITNLSVFPENKLKFGNCQTCELIIIVLYLYGKNSLDITKVSWLIFSVHVCYFMSFSCWFVSFFRDLFLPVSCCTTSTFLLFPCLSCCFLLPYLFSR
jgi:hypothetical protein